MQMSRNEWTRYEIPWRNANFPLNVCGGRGTRAGAARWNGFLFLMIPYDSHTKEMEALDTELRLIEEFFFHCVRLSEDYPEVRDN